MILEEETFRKFGYHSKDLKEQSNKHVLVACDECGKIRVVYKYAYRNLCKSCAMKRRKHSKETKQKISDSKKGKLFFRKT